MFQSFALFKHMTVGENIAFGPRIQKQDVNLEAMSAYFLGILVLSSFKTPASCTRNAICIRNLWQHNVSP